jgi:hypothetical protein
MTDNPTQSCDNKCDENTNNLLQSHQSDSNEMNFNNWLLIGIGFFLLAAGFVFLAFNFITLSPILILSAYLVMGAGLLV